MVDVTKFPRGGMWIPSEKPGSKWVLVALHGSGGSYNNFSGLESIFNIPELNYLYLNGPIAEYSNFRWYDTTAQSRQQAVMYLATVFETLKKEGYSLSQTFLLGFSQGAALTFEFGVHYQQLLAGYIAISGRIEDLPGLLNQANPLVIQGGKWLVTHGTGDYNLSVDVMRQQVQHLKNAGFRIEYQEYDKIHEFDAKKELPDVKKWVSEIIRN